MNLRARYTTRRKSKYYYVKRVRSSLALGKIFEREKQETSNYETTVEYNNHENEIIQYVVCFNGNTNSFHKRG